MRKRRIVQAGLLLLALAAVAAGLALRRPGDAGAETLVQDQPGLLTPAQRGQIEDYHAAILEAYDLDYRVVVLSGAPDVNAAAARHFAETRIGNLSATGRGLLLVIAPEIDKVRIEVGRSLEPVFTDAFVAYIEERQMVPFFRSNRVADGILATTEMIVTRAQNAARNAGFDDEPWAAFTTGAGATSAARLGQRDDDAWRRGTANVTAQHDTPDAVVAAYLTAMDARNANPDLPIYSEATRAMLAEWVVTPAQMDNVVAAYGQCHAEAPRLAGDRAVIRYPPAERACAPWFLVREAGGWRLDLATLQRAVRFGRDNAWRFADGLAHPYAFAFADWRFDRNGFPRTR